MKVIYSLYVILSFFEQRYQFLLDLPRPQAVEIDVEPTLLTFLNNRIVKIRSIRTNQRHAEAWLIILGRGV